MSRVTSREKEVTFNYAYNSKADVNEAAVFFVSAGIIVSSFLLFLLVWFVASILITPFHVAQGEGQFWSGALFAVGTFASIGVAAFFLHKLDKKAQLRRQEARRENEKQFRDGMLNNGYAALYDASNVDLFNCRGAVFVNKALGEQFKIVHADCSLNDEGNYEARVCLVLGFYSPINSKAS